MRVTRSLYDKSRLVNLPNLLSLVRLVLIIPLAYFLSEKRVYFASLNLIIIFLTDVLDGYFARKWHLENPLGKILDHGVDKVVYIFISILFYKYASLPYWALLFLVIREFIILVIGGALYFVFKLAFGSLWIGKIAGIFYFAMLFSYLFGYLKIAIIFLALTVTLFSLVLIVYPLKYFPIVKETFLRKRRKAVGEADLPF